MKLLPEIEEFVKQRRSEFDQVAQDRKKVLEKLAQYIRTKKAAGEPVRLIFICTHNSRRSHMAQIWAQTAAHHCAIQGVETFSGGTEATAFNPNAVKAMKKAGFSISPTKDANNPIYVVKFTETAPPLKVFSKVFDQPGNPATGFAAVMTCSQADENCPFIPGADLRIPVTYEDPKAYDGTPQQDAMYFERNIQIAREMLYLFSITSS